MKHKISILLLLAMIATTANSYRVLGLFPHPGLSHFHIFEPIMRGLANAGHDVTVVSHFPRKTPLKNYRDLQLTGLELMVGNVNLDLFKSRASFNHLLEFFFLYQWGKDACEIALNSSAIQHVLNSGEKYDVVLLEQFNSDCMSGVAYKLNAPFIGLSSCSLMPWHYDRLGSPLIPSHIPALFLGYAGNMPFTQRLSNWLNTHLINIMYNVLTHRASNQLIQKYIGDGIPDTRELVKKTSLILVNTHYSMIGARPYTPSVIEIGGVHIEEPKTLDPEIQELLDTADNGVIYVSWGSMIRAETLPVEKREGLLQALGQLPQRVLWKWENDTLPNKPDNVFVRKWMPQREILCHPKTRLFLTHGGLLGSSEAAYCGVPVISTPMYGDQFFNSASLVNRGMGVVLDFERFYKDNIYEAIKKVLDPSYSDNAKKVSYAYKNRERPPLETAIHWVDHVVATSGAPLLQSNAVHMSWSQYYSLDVYALVFSVLSLVLTSWFIVLRAIFKKRKTPTVVHANKLKVK